MGVCKERIVKSAFLVVGVILVLSCCKVKKMTLDGSKAVFSDFNALSETFLEKVRKGHDVKTIQMQLAGATVDELATSLKTDAQRYAFWINIYNAYIITTLRKHPEYYDDKDGFFTENRMTIAGETISFDKIEHGILRRSQWKLGLGYIRKWFPNAFERKLRVRKRDFRIHFALNCGAKDCPPVAIYTPERVNEQLNEGTTSYLRKTTKIDSKSERVSVTPLFNWFRGDFGGKSGTKKILKNFGLIESNRSIEIAYSGYDWTLNIDNFIDF
ncbi:MAG: DUF547 domain-containing protein [Bacteroidota bacterium]